MDALVSLFCVECKGAPLEVPRLAFVLLDFETPNHKMSHSDRLDYSGYLESVHKLSISNYAFQKQWGYLRKELSFTQCKKRQYKLVLRSRPQMRDPYAIFM